MVVKLGGYSHTDDCSTPTCIANPNAKTGPKSLTPGPNASECPMSECPISCVLDIRAATFYLYDNDRSEYTNRYLQTITMTEK